MVPHQQIFKIKLTGTPAAHGDDAVAALDIELVEPYLTRPDKDCSLNDSDGTEISEKNMPKLISFRSFSIGHLDNLPRSRMPFPSPSGK